MFIFSGTLFQISYVCFEHYHNVHQNISRIIWQDLITEFILVPETSLGLATLLAHSQLLFDVQFLEVLI